jgi:tungstate transport system substrate-binding protein
VVTGCCLRRCALIAAASLLFCIRVAAAGEPERQIVMACTTSMESSGLLDHILPLFEARHGIRVRAVCAGTGQALRIARRGDADLVFVHDRPSEEAFVREGYGLERHQVMYNDFVVVGPASDPAGVRGQGDVQAAFRRIAAAASPFVSRGDDSGTHKAELRIWQAAGVDPRPASGGWYSETGSGQGATLNIGSAIGAYTLVDRGTWLAFKNRGELEVLVEGDERLRNPYGVICVDPARHPHVDAEAAQTFVDWLLSAEGQAAVGSVRANGRQLFTPDAASPGPADDSFRAR